MPVINCRVPAAAPRATMQATASGEYWGTIPKTDKTHNHLPDTTLDAIREFGNAAVTGSMLSLGGFLY
jgi:hypothetical protein